MVLECAVSSHSREPMDGSMRDNLKSCFVGCFAGLSVGDAIGLELEYDAGHGKQWLPGEIQACDVSAFEFGRPFDLDPGQYTDDTQMTLALAQSLVREGRVDGPSIARELSKLYTLDQVIGPSRACLMSVSALLDGRPWFDAGKVHDEPGNCPAKRAAPVGLLDVLHPERLLDDAVTSARITHHDPRSVAGAVAMASAVALVAAEGPVDCAALVEFAASRAEAVEGGMVGTYLRRLPEWLAIESEEEAIRRIAPAGREGWFRASYIAPHAIPSVLVSLYAVLRAGWDFSEALAIVYRAQGAVDSTGAMTGALVGAAGGAEAVPARLRDAVKDARKIRTVAESLYDKVAAQG